MKTSRLKRTKYFQFSLIYSALTLALATPFITYAKDGFVIHNNVHMSVDHAKRVNIFATENIKTMQSSTATYYLKNKKVADVSTLPSRLFAKYEKNPFVSAPFMPIKEEDLSCYFGIPSYKKPLEYDINTTPVNVEADSVTGSIGGDIIYKGNVVISQGDNLIKSNKTSYNQQDSILKSEGNSVYSSGTVTISTDKPIISNLKDKKVLVENSKFQLNGSVARGSSGKILLDNEKGTANLHDISFTTCPVNDNSWIFKASEVSLDENDYLGSAKNAVLYVKDIPVAYFPYITFPTTNERKSGLLYPSGSYSNQSGLKFAQPIYFNLATNYDYTFTPKIISKRGLILDNEFRYMPFENTKGTLNFVYLPHDKLWDLDENDSSRERYLIDLKHKTSFFNEDVNLDINYQKVRANDFSYITDIGADNISVTDDSLIQSLKTEYNSDLLNVTLETRTYQSLLPDNAYKVKPFSLKPQVQFDYTQNIDDYLISIEGDVTNFSSPSTSTYDDFNATRFHIEPSIKYQLFNNRGTTLNTQFRGFFTHYNQDSLKRLPLYYQDELGFTDIDRSVNRSLYLIDIRGKTTLEKKVLDLRHTQTLEPEVSYRFIPYKDQDKILTYDTTDRSTDYFSNYSFRNYVGADRIADNNSITLGLTTRLLDSHDRELYRFAVAQTYSFVPTRVKLNPTDTLTQYPRSPLTMSFDSNIIPEITSHASVSYTNEKNKIYAWNAMIEYKDENGLMGQLSYRFVEDGNRTFDNDNIVDLSQIGVQSKIPFYDKYNVSFAMYYDIEQRSNIDKKVSLSYEDCCYSVSFVYEDYTSTNWHDISRKSDKVFGVMFELKGVGSLNISGDANAKDTDTHLLPYFNPTNLNN